MDKPAILNAHEAFVVVPVVGTVPMHEAWYRARDAIIGGYHADKSPYEAMLAARPDPTALADVVRYVEGLEAENTRLREVVGRAQSIISTSTYPNWHECARAALTKETDKCLTR